MSRLCCLSWIILAFALQWSPVSAAEKPLNIIFILADDLGYGDLGSYGQTKIKTPNLDRIAAEGMRLTRHYSGSPVCAPSRCVLMTGRHPGHAQVRDNREVKPEGQHPLQAGTITLPRLLKARGYTTGAFGKWGLGPPGSSGDPLNQGFDRFFGYNCQRVAHNHYPTSLWDNATPYPLKNPSFPAHQKFPEGADSAGPENYRRYSGTEYAPDLIAEKALEFIQTHRDKPFFLYFPTTVPHLALQVAEDSIEEYKGQWPEEPYLGDRSYLPHPTPRAAYAAMITRMDRDIGRILSLVQKLNLDDQTLLVFTSDNGPLFNRLGGTDSDFFQSAKDLRGRKGSLYEGGIRVPCLVRWKGKIAPGAISDRVTGFEDWLPSLLELAGVPLPPGTELDGVSFAKTLLGGVQPPRDFLYREFSAYGGQQSVLVGEWKAIRQNLNRPDAEITTELYNLRDDPAEERNIAHRHPQRLAQLEALLKREHSFNAEFPLRAIDGVGRGNRRP